MDELIRLIGLALRLPFFLGGLVLASAFTLVYGGLSVLWFFLVLPLSWAVLGVPMAFFAISFRGSGTEQLKQRLGADIAQWEAHYIDHFSEFTNMYRGLYAWFIEGSG